MGEMMGVLGDDARYLCGSFASCFPHRCDWTVWKSNEREHSAPSLRAYNWFAKLWHMALCKLVSIDWLKIELFAISWHVYRHCNFTRQHKLNKAFIDNRLRPVSQRRHRRTEPQPQGIGTTHFVKTGSAVPEICSRTDKQTDRQTDKLIATLHSPTGAE